jgi:hypothetical protein
MNQSPAASEEMIEIDLRKPAVAAVLAWLWPGAGHLYQRRYAKGLLFMVCILGTFFFGLFISGGRAVYASFHRQDFRWQYICQLGVGAPALPALVQHQYVMAGEQPLLPLCYRDPETFLIVANPKPEEKPLLIADGFMAPPRQPVAEERVDALSAWHRELPTAFEMGTLFTMVAGLLNVLAIYDAYAGPVIATSEEEDEKPSPADGEGEKKNGT